MTYIDARVQTRRSEKCDFMCAGHRFDLNYCIEFNEIRSNGKWPTAELHCMHTYTVHSSNKCVYDPFKKKKKKKNTTKATSTTIPTNLNDINFTKYERSVRNKVDGKRNVENK